MEYVESQKVFVEFRMDSVPSQYQSEAAGHPVFVEKPFIVITIPGQPNTVIDTVADVEYQRRFPEQWARFKAGNVSEVVNGWRLESWPAVNTAQVKTLKHMGIHTVEMLADMSDAACQNVGMGTMELRTKAKAAAAAAAGGAQAEQYAAENKRLRDEMDALRTQVATMVASQGAAGEAPASRRPGRPARQAEGQEA
ncbi:hypothetical protein J2W35_004952 [Variovorax boronicumulans]|uniref:hypothetical protein n=1 Tax=Variovorax boronicumulans TaxID=436515 RepID=UPI00277D39C6|nr:hypothetical protein [Variovorax boronicumulans]MDQ0084583.1 hypothetical protein [Variovorax boronicumulans]